MKTKKISMQKMHDARTECAKRNLVVNEKLLAGFGGIYTQSERNMIKDLHPGIFACLLSNNIGTNCA